MLTMLTSCVGTSRNGAASVATEGRRMASSSSSSSSVRTTSRVHGAVVAPEALHWDVVVHEDLTITETICPAVDVEPVDARARAFMSAMEVVDGCRRFRLDLRAAADALQKRNAMVRVDDDAVMGSPDVWLWTTPRYRGGTLKVHTPPGFSVALPFPRDDADLFQVDASTWRLLSHGVIGKVEVRQVPVPGGVFEVVVLPGDRKMVGPDIDRWLQTGATAVATGRPTRDYPMPHTLVIVDPVWGDGVPFGMVSRGGGAQVLLLLGQGARLDDVIDGWVTTHELSHLLLPPTDLRDPWLGEGLASYHQNVLRSRAGLMSPADSWRVLVDGFNRGRAAAERGPFSLSLREASARMRKEARWLQTYWGGAAVALMMDVALRECSDQTLDDVVAATRAQQPGFDRKRVRAWSVVQQAAAVAPGCAGIEAMVTTALERPFPDVGPTLRRLGVDEEGRLRVGPRSDLRDRITAAVVQAR